MWPDKNINFGHKNDKNYVEMILQDVLIFRPVVICILHRSTEV